MTEMKPLTGSPKQIEWAEKIRKKAIEAVRADLSGEFSGRQVDAVVALAAKQTKASWWIDNKTLLATGGNAVITLTTAAGLTNSFGDVTETGKAWAIEHEMPF